MALQCVGLRVVNNVAIWARDKSFVIETDDNFFGQPPVTAMMSHNHQGNEGAWRREAVTSLLGSVAFVRKRHIRYDKGLYREFRPGEDVRVALLEGIGLVVQLVDHARVEVHVDHLETHEAVLVHAQKYVELT